MNESATATARFCWITVECVDWNLIKVAVTEFMYMNLTSFDADEHLNVNNSIQLKCLEEIEADKAIHHKVIQFSPFRAPHAALRLFWATTMTAKCYLPLHPKHDGSFCNTSYDGLLCWPSTKIDTTMWQPCFSEFQGVQYDVTSKYRWFFA